MKTIDLYNLLTIEQKEKVSEVFLDAMSNHNIFPEIWEMDIKAVIDSRENSMTDLFMQNHQLSLDIQREEDEINWLGLGPNTEDTEDEENFPVEINLEKIRLPNHWASYLANGVEDSLEDGEKETIQDVLDTANLSDHTCVDVLDDSHFELAPSWYPSLLAGDYCTYVFDKF